MDSLPDEIALVPGSDFDRDDWLGLGTVLLLGGTLSWLTLNYPTALPPWAPWDFSWVEFLATALGLWWYARGVLRSAPQSRPLSVAAGVVPAGDRRHLRGSADALRLHGAARVLPEPRAAHLHAPSRAVPDRARLAG